MIIEANSIQELMEIFENPPEYAKWTTVRLNSPKQLEPFAQSVHSYRKIMKKIMTILKKQKLNAAR